MNFRTITLALLFLVSLTSLRSWAQSSNEKDPLIAEASTVPYEWSPGIGGTLKIKMSLPKGYHAYEDKFSVVILEPDGFQVAKPELTPLVQWYDKFSKKPRKGMMGNATLAVHVEAAGHFQKNYNFLKVELSYQACSDQFCLFPTHKIIEVPIKLKNVENLKAETPVAKETAKPEMFSAESISKYLSDNLFISLLIAFVAGLLTSLTPCIFPMIPITLAVLGNHATERSRSQNLLTSCIYVLGIATTYSVMGLIAATTGGLFGASLGNPYVLSVVCLIFLSMALSMYGLFEFQVPAIIRDRFGRSKSQGGLFNAFLTGIFAGIVASPCVGPVLVAILTHVASTHDMLRGFLLLFFYALGLGLIFILLGLWSNFIKMIPRSGPWMNSAKFVLGTLMLMTFYYYLNLLVPERWFDGALGLGLIVLASVYGAFLPRGLPARQNIQKGLMQATLLIGVGYIILSVFDLRPFITSRIQGTASLNQVSDLHWQDYSAELLQEAAKNKKPVIIDFWAEWCAACHELAENTFTDPRVMALAQNFVLIKFDATADSPLLIEMKKKYQIQGLPTVVFINPHGEWQKDLTLTQFEKADEFMKRMERGIK